ncbi:hypothetical protein O9K51_09642 [Purpureocillium lavendulum]|uniref:Uncharacterized protein n=1 Tax=Purpureocillium lavendulum TaxID=1247861 RepID=A0AB34FEE1_9HYPO|nr:hypothetical protein O9K51_09642 [Purpureocillium lavendulum]
MRAVLPIVLSLILCAGSAWAETFIGTCVNKKCQVLTKTEPIGWENGLWKYKQTLKTFDCTCPTKCYQDGAACMYDQANQYVRCVA